MPHITLTVVQHFGIDCFWIQAYAAYISTPNTTSNADNADTNMLILFNLAKNSKINKKKLW